MSVRVEGEASSAALRLGTGRREADKGLVSGGWGIRLLLLLEAQHRNEGVDEQVHALHTVRK